MAAFDFPPNATDPNPPEVGDLYSPPGSDITYQWNGTVWNASVGSTTAGVSLVEGGDGIDTSPVAGITATGSVAVDSTVVRTTGAQTINGVKTFTDGLYGNTFGGTQSYTSTANGTGTSVGSITGINDTKLTIATTGNAFGAQLVTPDDQYVEVVSGSTAYARFNAADTSFRVGGTLATAPNIKLNADGTATFAENVTVGGNPANGVAEGVSLDKAGQVTVAGSADADTIWQGYKVGAGAGNYSSVIKADGSATFVGFITAGNATQDQSTSIFYNNSANSALYARNYGTGPGLTCEMPSASKALQVNDSNGDVDRVVIYGDGSATFVGSITSASLAAGNISINGTQISSSSTITLIGNGGGAVYAKPDDPNSTFRVYQQGSNTNFADIRFNQLTTNRAFNFPNNSGTVALTSDITGTGVTFKDALNITATPPTASAGDIFVNNTAGNANSGFTGLNEQFIALNQLVFFTASNNWVAGGITDSSTYVTTGTDQTVTGYKTFSNASGAKILNLSLFNDTVSSAGTLSLQGNGGGGVELKPSDGNSTVAIYKTGGSIKGEIRANALSANRQFTLPNATGTIALTTDLPSVGNGQINVNAGNGLTASGTNATANQSGNTTRTLSVAANGSTISVSSSGISVVSAPQLTTTRTLWGQNFNGTGNVSGNINMGSGTLTTTGSLSDGTTTKTMNQVLNPPPSVPTGSVFYFAAATAPSGYLACDGSAVSRTTYADLFAVCSTTFGSGDGSSTFNLPDLRGEFIRGFDAGRNVDSGRAFGSTQASACNPGDLTVNDPGHKHTASTTISQRNGNFQFWYNGTANKYENGNGTGHLTASLNNNFFNAATTLDNNTTGITITSTSGANETRPRNVALLPCIKT